jgi:ClpX C4-type zinc finger
MAEQSTGNLPRAHRDAHCSFCGKSFRDIGPLFEESDKREAGKSVYICRNCVELAASMLDQEAKRQAARKNPAWRNASNWRSRPIAKELFMRVDLEPEEIDALLESVKSSAIRLCEEKQSDAERESLMRLAAVQSKLRYARAHGPTTADRLRAGLRRLGKKPRT